MGEGQSTNPIQFLQPQLTRRAGNVLDELFRLMRRLFRYGQLLMMSHIHLLLRSLACWNFESLDEASELTACTSRYLSVRFRLFAFQ